MEEIARRRPIDRTAALVTQPGPKGLEPSKRITQRHSDTPIAFKPFDGIGLDVSGVVVGRLTTLGIAADYVPSKNGKRLWVCRCVCGRYVTRRSPAIRNPKNDADCCDYCRNVQYLRRASTFRALGFNPDQEPARRVRP